MSKIKIPLLAFLSFALGFFAISVQGKDRFGKCPSEYGFQGSYNFGKKEKSFVSIRDLNEIAPAIRAKIEAQLTDRVGPIFFKRLKFDFGDADDFDSDARLLANDASRIDGYDLVFKFSDKSRGLKAYNFKVVADEAGNIISNLALPDIASFPEKVNLIPCKQALQIAKKNGFPLDRSSIYINYDWESQNLIWEIHDNKAVEPDEPSFWNGLGTFRHCIINSSTGEVIRIVKVTILV